MRPKPGKSIPSAAYSNDTLQFSPEVPNAPQASLPTKSSKSGAWLFPLGIVLAIAGAAAFIVGPSLLLKAQKAMFKPEYLEKIEVRHEVIGEAKSAQIPTAESLITPAIRGKLFEGKGLEVDIISTYEGKDDERHTFSIPPWQTLDETTPDQRQTMVLAKITELQNELTSLAQYAPRDWNFVVVLDDTDGMSKELKQKFDTVYDDLRLDERVKHGDAVTVYFAKISSTNYLDNRKVSIPKGAKAISEALQSELNSAKQWLLQDKRDSGSSAVFRGIFNILKEYSSLTRARVVILSDMIENDPTGTGLRFYTPEGQKQLDRTQWEALDQLILSKVPKPNIKEGVTVKIYAPPSVKKNEKVAQLAQDYGEHLLTQLGAKVDKQF